MGSIASAVVLFSSVGSSAWPGNSDLAARRELLGGDLDLARRGDLGDHLADRSERVGEHCLLAPRQLALDATGDDERAAEVADRAPLDLLRRGRDDHRLEAHILHLLHLLRVGRDRENDNDQETDEAEQVGTHFLFLFCSPLARGEQ